METLHESNVNGVDLLFRGKVRDVYDLGDALLIVATDRLSAFDVVLPTPIPGKGRILTQLSNYWFAKTAAIVRNHLLERALSSVVRDAQQLDELDGRAVIVVKAVPLKVEAIVRGYLAGSGWAEYQAKGSVSGVDLPGGLRESARLPEPIFTPSTKAPSGQHDENISFDDAAKVVGAARLDEVRRLSLALYRFGAAWAESRGIILADTKFEFGIHDDRIILIDELMTPDSSRFWPADGYAAGRAQPSFDKQYVRDYLLSIGWDKRPPAPALPPEIATRTAAKYREALDRLSTLG